MTITIAEGVGITLALSLLIQIAPIEINPWSWLLRTMGKIMNEEVVKQVSELKKDFDVHKKESDDEKAKNCRRRLLRFGDELLQGEKHSKEHFDQIIDDVSEYKLYCEQHKNDFKNDKAEVTMDHIEKVYRELLDKGGFL